MAQNDVFRITYVQRLNDVRFANVVAFRQTAANGANDPRQDVADAWFEDIAPLYVAALSDEWGDLCVHVRQVGLPGMDYFRVLSPGNVGARAAKSLPGAICVNQKLCIADQGRGGSGRLFFSGVFIDDEEDNCLNSAAVTRFQAIGTRLINPIGVSGQPSFEAGLVKPGGVFKAFFQSNTKTALTVLAQRKNQLEC